MYGPLHDAWKTLAPDARDAHGPLSPLLVSLTIVTGTVDAFSYLVLGHVFVANMTGNVVFVAFAIAGAAGFSLAASLTALGAFALGALLGGRMRHRAGHGAGAHRGRLAAQASALETLLFCGALLCSALAIHPVGAPRYLLIVVLGLAMGVQNAVARALAVPDLTTTVLTLTITGIAADGRAAGGSNGKVGRRMVSVVAMLVGALVGASVTLHASPPLALLIGAAILATVATVAWRLSRTDRPWAQFA